MIQSAPVRDRNRAGFTLIELLIVIAIIAVLAGFAFPVFQGVQDRAKKVQAKNDLTQIVTAVNAYYTEYGKYPIATDDTPLDATKSADLFYTLRAISGGSANQNNAANSRQIVFLSPAEDTAKANPRGKIGSDGRFYDPWGTAYNVAIDGTYDTDIDNPYSPDTGAGPAAIHQGVIAWCYGKDQKIGNNGDKKFTNSDDVISWQ
jgi:prepilin-type N-terminal cleavage/methylation domain-containing protein